MLKQSQAFQCIVYLCPVSSQDYLSRVYISPWVQLEGTTLLLPPIDFLLTFSGVGQPIKSFKNLWISYLIGELAFQDVLWVSGGEGGEFRGTGTGLKGARGYFHFSKASYPSIKVYLFAASLLLVHYACHPFSYPRTFAHMVPLTWHNCSSFFSLY